MKLTRAQAEYHASHPDTEFAKATIKYLENVASLLGPEDVFFLSQDDKARVPIGITAAKSQAPILMHMEYRVTLPDHDWVVAQKHKLIPSVYAGICIKPQGMGRSNAVSYSGPTFIGIRSGKHGSSNASTHANDLDTVVHSKEFSGLAKNSIGDVKPIFMITVDGGPDENPRYSNVIAHAVAHFKRYNLDAFFMATNAPGRSAFNRVERRMAPLSRELSGVILPHDHFGTHLDHNGKTIDDKLERKNFDYAGNVLADIWSSMMIDSHPVKAVYISDEKLTSPSEINSVWYSNHVRESQYFLQIVKCTNTKCCGTFKSSLLKILPDRFLPPPIKIKQSSTGLQIASQSDSEEFIDIFIRRAININIVDKNFVKIPYDYFCPSVISQLKDRTCKKCGLYHSSKKSLVKHLKNVHVIPKVKVQSIRPVRIAAVRANEKLCILQDEETGATDAEWVDDDDLDSSFNKDIDVNKKDEESSLPVINNINDWLISPWSNEN